MSKTGISTQNYLYDDQGRRIQKTASAPVNYLYNGSQIVNQYDSGWTLPNFRFTYGPGADAPTTRANSTGSQYYHQNGIGNVVAVTNQAGATDGTAAYDPWGNLSTSTGTIPAYGFTGREPDETGLIYYRARYYDPTIGRFAETDPIGLKGGLNRYQYVGNNPILYTDSSGLCRDPGGSGIRYCIDTYIPQDWVWSVPSLNIQGFKGDNRGPQAYGGTLGGFRTEQLIYQGSSGTTTSSFRPGVSTFCAFGGCVSADAVAGAAGFSVQDQAAGGRIIQAYGAASDGLFHGAAPNASYNLRIFESGDANATAWVIGAVTPYPNTEVWQYGGPNGPQLILNYDSAKAGADTRDLLGPLPFDPYGGTLIDVGTCSNCTPAPRSQTLDSFNFDKGSVTSPNK